LNEYFQLMGFRSHWLAFDPRLVDSVLSTLGLARTGRTVKGSRDTGWYVFKSGGRALVIGDGWDFKEAVTEQTAQALSSSSRVMFWRADDSTMTGRLVAYHSGRAEWSLTHTDEEPGKIEGEAPEVVRAGVEEARKLQVGVTDVDHVYDAVHEAGKRLVGFRHDEGKESDVYEELTRLDRQRVIREGPFEAVFDFSYWTVMVRALRPVTVDRYLVLSFSPGETELPSGVDEIAGLPLAEGATWSWSLARGHDSQVLVDTPESRFALHAPAVLQT